MANYYDIFVKNITLEEHQADWAMRLYGELSSLEFGEDPNDKESEEFSIAERIFYSSSGKNNCESLGFYCIQYEGYIQIGSEEYYNELILVEFVQAILARFNLDISVGISVGCTCDKDIPGAHGGVAHFITKDNVENIGTGDWLTIKKNEHQVAIRQKRRKILHRNFDFIKLVLGGHIKDGKLCCPKCGESCFIVGYGAREVFDYIVEFDEKGSHSVIDFRKSHGVYDEEPIEFDPIECWGCREFSFKLPE